MQNLHRPVSNRGQWRESLVIYTDGIPDPSQTVFAFAAWPRDAGPTGCDYGWRRPGYGRGTLSATNDDETGRLAVAVNGNSLIVAWQFPDREMQGLPAGSYEASISAMIADEAAEIETVNFVVQARGGPRLNRLSPAFPAVPPLPPTSALTPEAVAALLPLLPTEPPIEPGKPWNNGGLLSWS